MFSAAGRSSDCTDQQMPDILVVLSVVVEYGPHKHTSLCCRLALSIKVGQFKNKYAPLRKQPSALGFNVHQITSSL